MAGTNGNRRIFADICALAANCEDVVNLGQGFPDFSPPQHVLDTLVNVVQSDDPLLHQYCRSFGHLRLVNVLSRLYSPCYGRELDPLQNIIIPVGAYGGLVCSIESSVGPGDEVILFEPYFDCYKDMIIATGAKPVFVPLVPKADDLKGQAGSSSDWTFDEQTLLSKIDASTKAILLNSPSNPLGKVFNQKELEIIRDICIEFDLTCISDEVYERMIYDSGTHVKIGTMEGMWERTLTIGSAGKTFSATGWKLGWVIGPEALIFKCMTVFQRCYYRCPTPIQEAVARALETELTKLGTDESYLTGLSKVLQEKRDYLVSALSDLGLSPIIPEGGYFILVDVSNFLKNVKISSESPNSSGDAEDMRFVKWLIREKKLGTIPASLFFTDDRKDFGRKFIRLCFAKKASTLESAVKILQDLKCLNP